MDTRSEFLLQLLQKLGAPLMQAVGRHSAGDTQKDAATMASLLSDSVKISISLSQAMNIKEQDGNADAIRVTLATLAAGLVADFYGQSGRTPSGNDTARIGKSLESVIVFADNFAPAAEHAKRLKTLDGTPPFFDSVQANIYAVHALLPAMAAIAEFSFGQAETKFIQDVAEKLRAQTKEVLGKISDGSNEMDELVMLQALAQIYESVHRAETAKLKASGAEGGLSSLGAIWMDFGKQVAMLEALMGGLSGNGQRTAGSSGAVSLTPSVTDNQQPLAQPIQPAQTGGSPMSFFKKK